MPSVHGTQTIHSCKAPKAFSCFSPPALRKDLEVMAGQVFKDRTGAALEDAKAGFTASWSVADSPKKRPLCLSHWHCCQARQQGKP